MSKSILIIDIKLDSKTQQRPVDETVVARYAALMKDGVKFPAVDIISDGKHNFLIDGYHRVAVARKNGQRSIEANIKKGTHRDAIYASFAANKANAFPRQPGTAKGIVEKILQDKEWSKTPQTEIAQHVGVTHQFVSKIQAELEKLSCNQLHDRTALSEPKEGLERAKTVKVKRGGSEYEAKVPERKVLDATGKEVPEHLVKYFSRANEYRVLRAQVHAVYKVLKDGKESGDLFYQYINISHLTAAFNTAKHNIKHGMPYAVCGYCGGDERNAECGICNGSGFVNEAKWRVTPREFK